MQTSFDSNDIIPKMAPSREINQRQMKTRAHFGTLAVIDTRNPRNLNGHRQYF